MNSTSVIKIAVAQMCSVDNVSENLELIKSLSKEAKDRGAEIVFFPENCLFMRLDKTKLPPYLTLESEAFLVLQELSSSLGISIHLGGVGISSGDKNYNACVFLSPGKPAQRTYEKRKLFDIDLPGKHSYRESDAYSHGSRSSVLNIKGFSFGESICFDLRFAELYTEYKKHPVDCILVPSSFLVPTGEAHWHILNRARAIENQCYVISAAQAGNHKGRHQSYGHSLVIDPWGKILLDMENFENKTSVVEISKPLVTKTRMNMPMG